MSTENHNIEHYSHANKVRADEESRPNETLQNKKSDRKEKGYHPKRKSVELEELLQRADIVFERARKSGRDLNSSLKKEVTHTTNAADQDMAREKSDQRAETTDAHQEEYQAGKDGADGEGENSGCND